MTGVCGVLSDITEVRGPTTPRSIKVKSNRSKLDIIEHVGFSVTRASAPVGCHDSTRMEGEQWSSHCPPTGVGRSLSPRTPPRRKCTCPATITCVQSGLCLDLTRPPPTAPAQLWTCDSVGNQQWKLG